MFNKQKMSPTTYNYRMKKAMGLLRFSLMLAHQQINNGNFFILEHPASASSWSNSTVRDFILCHPSVVKITFDQCRFGLRCPDGSMPIKKGTTLMTNSPHCLRMFQDMRCMCTEQHKVIQGTCSATGKALSTFCQHYPPGLCQCIAHVARLERDYPVDSGSS